MVGMRIQFSIRDLFWLALVVALIVGWLLERTHLQNLQKQLNAANAEKAAKIDDLEHQVLALQEKLKYQSLKLIRLNNFHPTR